MEVRWGLEQLGGLLGEQQIAEPLLVTSGRWRDFPLPVERRFTGVRSHAPLQTVQAAIEAAHGADGLVALGGGSAIDTAKAVSAATGLRVVSVPTTYSGAEWTDYFGMRDEATAQKGGGSGARLAGVVYAPELTLDLPRGETVGTALNALAHSAEALYVQGRNSEGDREALAGAALVSGSLPEAVEQPRDLETRTRLLKGAAHGGAALAASGLGLGHAMAQALGGRYGLPHGALNAITLPPALRFNEEVAANEIAAFGEAMGTADPVERIEELARLAGFERLRDLGVPEEELNLVGEATAVRGGARANPRPATPAEIAELLRSVW
jgi:maleylacetate reductase